MANSKKALDENGVLYLWGKVKTYVATAIANIKLPSKTSDLTNDSGFITAKDVPEGAAASSTVPKMDGTAAAGTETAFARGDQCHYWAELVRPVRQKAFNWKRNDSNRAAALREAKANQELAKMGQMAQQIAEALARSP